MKKYFGQPSAAAGVTIDFDTEDVKFHYNDSHRREYTRLLIRIYSLFLMASCVFLLIPNQLLSDALVLFVPFLLTFIVSQNKKFLCEYYPKSQYYLTRICHCWRIPSIAFRQADTILELPTFSNVILEYEASGDFSKYLKRLEIRRIPFNDKMSLRTKIERNFLNRSWRARFYFSHTCNTGNLNIKYI